MNTRPYTRIIDSPDITPLGTRPVDTIELGPLTAIDTLKYLYARLRAIGVVHPHRILPITTCVALHRQSGGWPGALDDLIMRAIDRADKFPIRREHIDQLAAQIPSGSNADSSTVDQVIGPDMPELLVTVYGDMLREFEMKESIVLIGRARINDLVLNDRYVSKFHALLIFSNNTLFLVDLKSANGIYVNSHRVLSSVLGHDDVIEIGNYRIKIFHPSSRLGVASVERDSTKTSNIKTVADMRQAFAKKILRIAPTELQRLN